MPDDPATPVPTPVRGIGLRGVVLVLSLFANIALLVLFALIYLSPTDPESEQLPEKHYSGDPTATDKVAIVRVAGVLMDGTNGYAHRQIEQAAKDKSVKAVVVRIESPGGTITASEELYRSLTQLRDNSHKRFMGTGPKPLVASMGAIAASGGYYIAMPAGTVVAEPYTITGSIGVFAALPNVSELANRNGIKLELVKAGDIKAGGSPFQTMAPEERQPWQDMVDHAYDRFLTVVATGRPALKKEQLVHDKIERMVPLYDDKGLPRSEGGKPLTTRNVRYRADGGTFTPPQAKELGLIDEIADLSTAGNRAAEDAQLSRYKVVTYERQKTLAELLLGVEAKQPAQVLSAEQLSSALTPRLWYLSPHFELAGLAITPHIP